jgi:glutamate-ammonia-ligase adenylyltransferase
MTRTTTTLTELARLGFADLDAAHEALADIPADVVPAFTTAADPDQAVRLLGVLRAAAPKAVTALLKDPEATERLIRILGASAGLAGFLERHPTRLAVLSDPLTGPADSDAVTLTVATAGLVGERAWNALRIEYRAELVRLAAWDLSQPDGALVVDRVAAGLADLAGAALDAALDVARRSVKFPADEVAATPLAIIGMGKSGARELNYLSDVDVIFVTEGTDRQVDIATALARETMRAIAELAVEPPLWEVDANLRPEGKDGALVRTLESHLAYYERWAKSW